MGLLGVDQNSAKQTSISATDFAKVFHGKNTLLESGSLQIGKGGSYNESGSITVGKGGVLKTSQDLSGATIGGNVQIGASAGEFGAALRDVGGIVQNVAENAQSQNAALVEQVTRAIAANDKDVVPWYREPAVWTGAAILGGIVAVLYWLSKD